MTMRRISRPAPAFRLVTSRCRPRSRHTAEIATATIAGAARQTCIYSTPATRAAFSPATPGTFGNVGRNTLTGPGLVAVDASLNKLFKPSERINVQLRAEVFNLLDHANFYEPIFNVFAGGGARYSASAGNISQLISSPGGRLIQLGLKVTF